MKPTPGPWRVSDSGGSVIDAATCDTWSETPRMARKEHRCSCCRGTIAQGTPYVAHFNVYDGDASYQKMCAPCWFAREDFGQAHQQWVTPSYLAEALHECFGEESREYWEDDDRRWRQHYAGILIRRRAANRSLTKAPES